MATTPVKKVAAKTKAPVVPAKKIVAAAAKAPAAKAANASAAKPAVAAKSAVAAKPAVATNKAVKPVKKPVAATKAAVSKPALAKPVAGKPSAPSVSAAASKDKPKKAKLVRDSFTMPETEYEVLSQVKKACISAGVEVKKSQLLRIGLVLLKKTDVAALKNLIAGLEPLKAGRPKKEK